MLMPTLPSVYYLGDPSSDDKAMGGGLFVSILAKNLGFNLATSGNPQYKPLNIDSMVVYSMLSKKPHGWVNETTIPKRISKAIKGRLEREESAKLWIAKRTCDKAYLKRKAPTQAKPIEFEEEACDHMKESLKFMEEVCTFMEQARINFSMSLPLSR